YHLNKYRMKIIYDEQIEGLVDTVDYFFSIDSNLIAKELWQFMFNIDGILKELRKCSNLDDSNPNGPALTPHFVLILARTLRIKVDVPPEVVVYFASLGATIIADMVESIESERRSLTIRYSVDETGRIQSWTERKNNESQVFSEFGQKDHSSVTTDKSYDEKISDTINTYILSKYGFDDLSDLYDKDRDSFDLQVQTGAKNDLARIYSPYE
ncbi:MAG: hypothetical protein P8L44_03435, partial [Opitutales bacterium]|nr:hypothetical protein [Opitutales bacterium]